MDKQIETNLLSWGDEICENTTYFFKGENEPFQIVNDKIKFMNFKCAKKMIVQPCVVYSFKDSQWFITFTGEFIDLYPYYITGDMQNIDNHCPELRTKPEWDNVLEKLEELAEKNDLFNR